MTFKEKLEKQVKTREKQLEHMRAALQGSTDEEEKQVINDTINKIIEEMNDLKELISEADEPADGSTSRAFNVLSCMSFGGDLTNDTKYKRGDNGMNNPAEIRSFKKYITNGGKGLTGEEARSLTTNGAAAVIPVEIYNELITAEKYSDLLHRAKVFNEQGAGKLYIPIASDNAASWHAEFSSGAEASPEITKIELGGYELMRLMSMSAAADSMTDAGFKSAMIQLLSSEVIETLEYSFINGTGSGQPQGLSNLKWITSGAGQNAIVTEGTKDISFRDIAAGLSLLPQKYARNAILLMSADTAYNTISAADDSNGQPIYNIGEAAQSVLGHEIVISEHCPANTIYVVDPRELYIRFSMPLQVETDRSSGFTSASVNIRALCVVDSAWNSAACVRITKGAAA